MLAVDKPQPAHTGFSLFRRFSRRNTSEHNLNSNHDAYNAVIRSPARLRKRSPSISLPTPPVSPAPSKTDSVLEARSPSPHLTKDKTYRKERTITHIHRIDVPQVARDRLFPESPSFSSSSKPSLRVRPTAMSTSPFPSHPQSHIDVATWDIFLPPSQVYALYLGFQPRSMEDKWFIYSEGPDPMGKLKVHFHRSWTGAKMAELFVVMDVKGEGAGKIVGVKWNAGPDVGSGKMNADEAKYLVRTTVKWAMGVNLEEGK